jgi:hypothetical protein
MAKCGLENKRKSSFLITGKTALMINIASGHESRISYLLSTRLRLLDHGNVSREKGPVVRVLRDLHLENCRSWRTLRSFARNGKLRGKILFHISSETIRGAAFEYNAIAIAASSAGEVGQQSERQRLYG